MAPAVQEANDEWLGVVLVLASLVPSCYSLNNRDM